MLKKKTRITGFRFLGSGGGIVVISYMETKRKKVKKLGRVTGVERANKRLSGKGEGTVSDFFQIGDNDTSNGGAFS